MNLTWTLNHAIDTASKKYGNQSFLTFCSSHTQRTRSFLQLSRISSRLAVGLQKQLKIQKGSYVLVVLPNCLEYLEIWGALSKLGAIAVFVNPGLTDSFFEYICNDSGVRISFI